MHHADRHRAVERGERVGRQGFQQAVQREDLGPVGVGHGRGLVVDRGYGRLQLVGAGRAARQRFGEQRGPLGDLLPVPLGPVLLGQRHQRPVRLGAGGPPRVGQQHQRQQAGHLAVLGQQPAQPAGEPDRLPRQRRDRQLLPVAGAVALAEDQVQHVQHGLQPLGPLRRGRDAEIGPGLDDRLLGPADPLRHGRLRHAERRGDLRRRQAADRTQGQRDLAGRRQRGMAAAEQQGQRVVMVCGLGIGRRAEQLGLRGGRRDQVFAVPPGLLAADLVHQAARADRDQPAARVLRYPLRWPPQRRREQRLLAGVLAQVELPVPAHQGGEDLRRQLAQQVLDARAGGHSSGLASCRIGQTSTGSTSAHGMSAAICSARSSLSQSSR